MASAVYKVETPDGRMFGPADGPGLRQWVSEGRIPREALIHEEGGPSLPAWKHPVLADLAASLPSPADAAPLPADSTLGGLIPTGNPPSLVSYYVGIVSLLPIVGIIAAPVAIIYGVKALKAYHINPRIKGKTHARVGIICGILGALISLGCVGSWGLAAIARLN